MEPATKVGPPCVVCGGTLRYEKSGGRCVACARRGQQPTAKNTEYMRAWRDANRQKTRDTNKRYRERHRIKVLAELRDRHFRRKYGITADTADAMVAAAGGCAICGGAFRTRADAHVDHCHASGAIRGILCGSCNRKLGWYEKNRAGVSAYLSK